MEIILASSSPRRIELMEHICSNYRVMPSGVDETLPENITPVQAVELLADRKAAFLAKDHPKALVIGADTVVAIDGQILGKPQDREDAARMLRLLSGRTHTVCTGVALYSPQGAERFSETTRVTFYPLDEKIVGWYLETGEPFDKAGAYGIQAKGSLLVERISGDYFNIMGFPVAKVARRMCAHLKQDAGEGAFPGYFSDKMTL